MSAKYRKPAGYPEGEDAAAAGESPAAAARPRPVAPTIYDVAKLAGVAPSTVSRTFSRPGKVSAETAEIVRAAAEELGYRAVTHQAPPVEARRRTGVIGVAVADLENPFYAMLVRGIQDAAEDRGYFVLLANARESGTEERRMLEKMLDNVDGLILTSSRMPDSTIRLLARQKPTVVLNRAVFGAPCAIIDPGRGTRRVLDHLHELGHREVMYIGGPESSWANGNRLRVLRDETAVRGMTLNFQGHNPPTIAGGAAATRRIRGTMPTAVITFNDLMAIGFVRGLADLGMKVPDDVSVAGYDDVLISRLVDPRITTIGAPLAQTGARGMFSLASLIDGNPVNLDQPYAVPTRLVIRESTGLARV